MKKINMSGRQIWQNVPYRRKKDRIYYKNSVDFHMIRPLLIYPYFRLIRLPPAATPIITVADHTIAGRSGAEELLTGRRKRCVFSSGDSASDGPVRGRL